MKIPVLFFVFIFSVFEVSTIFGEEAVATAASDSASDTAPAAEEVVQDDIGAEDGKDDIGAEDGATTEEVVQEDKGSEAGKDDVGAEAGATTNETTATEEKGNNTATAEAPIQSGPFIDLLGESLLSLQMVDETHAQLVAHHTNEALAGKSVVGLYFSADWCGPCRQFTPDLVAFYNKMNARRGKENKFEIVWISRCRDFDSFGQYFTHMNWLAMQPEDAMGQRGQMLSDKYKVKGIPTLVLLDDVGNVITTDARNKIPADKAGIGFPWRNPLARVYMTVFPKSLRLMVKSQLSSVKDKLVGKLKGAKKTPASTAQA